MHFSLYQWQIVVVINYIDFVEKLMVKGWSAYGDLIDLKICWLHLGMLEVLIEVGCVCIYFLRVSVCICMSVFVYTIVYTKKYMFNDFPKYTHAFSISRFTMVVGLNQQQVQIYLYVLKLTPIECNIFTSFTRGSKNRQWKPKKCHD